MNVTPYVQDVDQWVSYYLKMAEKKTLDFRDGYVTRSGRVLYPVESKRVVYREKEEPDTIKEKVKVEMVTPIQRSVDQTKQEVKEEAEDPNRVPPIKLDINLPAKTKTVIRKRAASVTTAKASLGDQLTKIKKRKV